MPKGFTESEKNLIGERLLEQGYRQFSAYGLKKTSIEELAAASGISKGAFYLFYESKEALFMDVIEQAEKRFRLELLEAIDLPGPSPRARLLRVFQKAFDLLKTTPILKFFTGSDYDLLFRRVPAEKFQQHLASDEVFIGELLDRCRKSGIPIRAQVEEISGLLYALVLTVLHEDDFGPGNFKGTVDTLMELMAAYCVGEVEVRDNNVGGSGRQVK
ncbi:MAG: TetR/AcrR family transcriptional regulator [Anaerolineaceae bacterium]|jgi:AcrR family transcriptional regulator